MIVSPYSSTSPTRFNNSVCYPPRPPVHESMQGGRQKSSVPQPTYENLPTKAVSILCIKRRSITPRFHSYRERYPSSALIHVTCVTRIRLQRPLLTHRINSRTHFTGILTQAALSRWRLLSVGFITCYSFRSMSLPCTLYHMRK